MRWAFHGIVVGVDAHRSDILTRVGDVLEHFGAVSTEAPADLWWVFEARSEGAATGPTTATHLDLETFWDAEALHVRGPGLLARLHEGGCHTFTDALVPLHVVTYLWTNLLRIRGLYTLHAGGLAHEGRGCLIVGDSGSGKSTLTLALWLQGWSLLSDDSLLLTGSGPVTSLALRRGIFLEPRSAQATFPGLDGRWEPCPLVEASKRRFVHEGPVADEAVPHLMVFPEVAGVARTTFEQLPVEEVLYELVRQSRLAELDPGETPAQGVLLATLAGSVVGVRARLGRDVFENTAAVELELVDQLSRPAWSPGSVERREHTLFMRTNRGAGGLLDEQSHAYTTLDASAGRLWELLARPDRVSRLATDTGLAETAAARLLNDFEEALLEG